MKKLYILSPKIKWKTFELLQDALVKDSGPVIENGDKVLWSLLKKKRIICFFASDIKNDMGISLEIPKRYKKWKKAIVSTPL